MPNIIVIRILIIVITICTSYVFYSYIFEPLVMKPLCLVNSSGCIRIGYYNYNNSALIDMRGSGIWVWFNGDKAYIYGEPVGQICNDPLKYVAAYVISTRTGLKEGYQCVMALGEVINFYESKGVEMSYIVKRVDNDKFDIYDALNFLNDEGVINLQTSS